MIIEKRVIKVCKFNKTGECTIESEMYTRKSKDCFYVVHKITDEKTHETNQYEYEFKQYYLANEYFNSVVKGLIC